MITDLNAKVDFNDTPFNIQRNGIAIYSLSDRGKMDYVSNNHFTHHYLNKYPKEILSLLDNYAEAKDEINNQANPYPVKVSKEPEVSNAKPIQHRKQKHEDEETFIPLNKGNLLSEKKESSKVKHEKTKSAAETIKIKQPSNTFKNFTQQILNCTKSGNEMYKTDLYKKEMIKLGKQTINRYSTKISSSK